jgi:hypothetical protein
MHIVIIARLYSPIISEKIYQINGNRVICAMLAGCTNLMQGAMMTEASSELLVQLPHHGLLDINDGEGLAVACIEGTVWITQSNDPRDIVIHAGQSFLLDKQGLALVAAPAGQATIAVGRSRSRPDTHFVQFDLPKGDRTSSLMLSVRER